MRQARAAAICGAVAAVAIGGAMIMREPARAADPAHCARLGDLAKNIMIMRQLEAPLSMARNMALANETPALRATVQDIAKRAYDMPGNGGNENRAQQGAFSNAIESDCFAGRI